MQVHDSMRNLPDIPHPVVTLGSFDGVHAGHRVIIRRLNDLAAQIGGSSVLVTFYPHPRKVLYPESAGKDLQMITSRQEKIMLLEEAGLDHLIIMNFTLDFSRTTSDDFVKKYLVGLLHAHTIVVGFNHYFGYNKGGNFDSLYAARQQYHFCVEEIPEQEIQNETVSSTKIRKALQEGNIQRANAYLEHYYMLLLSWPMKSHDQISEATSGLELRYHDPDKLLPPCGAYAVSMHQSGRSLKAMLLIQEEALKLFPLEDVGIFQAGSLQLYFHKAITTGQRGGTSELLEAVRELIY